MSNPARVFVTTSWDDDDRTGLKVAELLTTLALRGTFYVPTGRLGRDSCFSAGDLRTLFAAGFEIGAHTVSHPLLNDLDARELNHEVGECKKVLEQILAAEVPMFCYPKGRFNAQVERALKAAGYKGARTTQMLSCGTNFHRFAVPTTIQAYPHARSNYVRNLIRLGAFPVLFNAVPDLIRFKGWLQLGKTAFDRVLRQGGMWHLYGHPWEIEKLGLWEQLKEMLEYVHNRSDVRYVTNGQLVESVKGDVTSETEKLRKSDAQRVIS